MDTPDKSAPLLATTSVSKAIAEWLSRRILTGALGPGEPLVEAKIARELGVSRAPLREAIQRLASEGVIELIPRRSPIVAGFSLKEYRDLYDFRILVEGYVFSDFAKTATSVDHDALSAIIERMRASFAAANITAFRDGISDFHHYVYERTSNEVAGREASNLWRRTARYRNLVAHRSGASERSLRWHGAIVDAMRSRDGTKVQRILIEMLTTVRDEGIPFLTPEG